MNAIPNEDLFPIVPGHEEGSKRRSMWEYTDEDLKNYLVTPFSKFQDRVWKRPVLTPGVDKNSCQINWGLTLLDGTRLSDVQHAHRLQWCRKLTAILLNAPSDGIGPGAGSMNNIQHSFKWLVSWMVERGYQKLEEFTPSVIDEYIDDLPRFIGESLELEDGDISESQVAFALRILQYAWSERLALAKWGVASLIENPFYQMGVAAYAKAIATKVRGWIQPIPDEVAIPLFNRAAWFLGAPADDVTRLVNGFGNSPVSRCFSVLAGETLPWHVPLDRAYWEANEIQPQMRLRQLFDAVRDACAISIQGITGMRISELMGIEAGLDVETGLPHGVRIEASATGLYDLFIIRTVLSKTEQGLPREVDWVLGLRPKGLTEEPLAVLALRLLNGIYQPWRKHAKTKRLFLSFHGSHLPLKTTILTPMNSAAMRNGMKRFMERWVDLSGLPNESAHKIFDNDLVKWRESKGSIISSHMLRKTWAQFVFAVNPALLPAIQLQFHHLSIAMSDSGYIGNNPLLVTAMDSVATQQRNLLIFETVLGREPLAGKMGEQIEEATRDLAAKLKDLPTSDAWQATVKFCDDKDLKIFFNPHGKCVPLATSKMRCHNEVNTPLGLRVQPNSATRQPSLCAGCDCFVLDTRHAPFWEDRYLQNWISYKRAERMGVTGQFRVIKERAVQAGKLLKKIGTSIELLDQKVNLALKEDDVTA